MVLIKQEAAPLANLYRGSREPGQHNRGLPTIELEFRGALGLRFDDIFVGQLENAKRQHWQEVVFLDIGSGEGRLFSQILGEPFFCPKTGNFLRDNPEMHLTLVGLTDAPSPQHHLEEQQTDGTEHTHMHARNIYYSLSRRQTLEAFLKTQGITHIDFALASQSLRYLSPAVFREVVGATVEAMRESGIFIGVGFHEEVPGFQTEGVGDGLDVRNGKRTEPSLQTLLAHAMDMKPPLESLAQETLKDEEALQKTLNKLLRLGVLTEGEIAEAKEAAEKLRVTFGDATFARETDVLAGLTIRKAIYRLRDKKWAAIWRRKREVLENLSGVTMEYISQKTKGDNLLFAGGFVIRKG